MIRKSSAGCDGLFGARLHILDKDTHSGWGIYIYIYIYIYNILNIKKLYRYIIYGYLDMFVCIAYNSIKHESVTVAMITYNL